MASTGVHLLLVCAGLLAAAAATGLGSRDDDEPAGSGVRKEPLPASAGESHGRRDTPVPAPTTQRTTTMDPRETWLLFLSNSEKNTNRGGRGRGRKPKVSLPATPGPYNLRSYLSLLYSPEELQKHFYLLQKGVECAEHCAAFDELEETMDLGLAARLKGPRARLIEAAFHCRLRRSASVDRRTLQELSVYDLPDDTAFHRGSGLNLTTGQYTAPAAGFYALAATLHVALPERRSEASHLRDRVRLLICIQSQCQRLDSLETVMGLRSSSNLFTISVNGVLYLQMGQYASVFLDNASGSAVTVQSGSRFSAVLLGV